MSAVVVVCCCCWREFSLSSVRFPLSSLFFQLHDYKAQGKEKPTIKRELRYLKPANYSLCLSRRFDACCIIARQQEKRRNMMAKKKRGEKENKRGWITMGVRRVEGEEEEEKRWRDDFVMDPFQS